MHRTSVRLSLSALLLVLGALCVAGRPAAASPAATTGTLALTAGSCSGGVSGTYLRMILPNGGPTGPYMSNSDSPCADQTYTPLSPGSDGGLQLGGYQPSPNPRFDADGNALATRITRPAQFYGTGFALATSPRDPQTGASVPAPVVTISGTHVTADLRAWAVTWNQQDFNQGAPKPDGSYPGNTRAATGTYDPATGALTLDWTSQVVGGPFDKFTGAWHLSGHLVRGTAGSGGGTATGGQGAGAARVVAGRTITPGAAAAPTAAASAAAAPQAGAAADTTPVASTTVVVTHGWRAQWWLLALLVVLAVVGVGGIWWSGRRAGGAA